MSKKYIKMADLYDIINLSKTEKLKDLQNEYSDRYGASTVARLARGYNSLAEKHREMREFILNDTSWDQFKEKYWNYFPEPENWNDVNIIDVWNKYHKYGTIKTINHFDLMFGEAAFDKLIESGELKKYFQQAWARTHKMKDAEIKVEKKIESSKTVKELIDEIKRLTGAISITIKV